MSDPEPARRLADVVRSSRRLAGMTQEEFADAVGMSQRWVSDLERSVTKKPRLDTLRRMARVLGLNIADLVILSGMADTIHDASRIVAALGPAEGRITIGGSGNLATSDEGKAVPEHPARIEADVLKEMAQMSESQRETLYLIAKRFADDNQHRAVVRSPVKGPSSDRESGRS